MTSQTSKSNGVATGVDGGVEIASRARIRGLVSRRRRRLSGRVVKVKPLVQAHRSAAFARGNVTAPRKVGRPRVGRPCVGRASRLVSFSFGKNSVPGGYLSGTGPLRRGLDRTRESRKRSAEFIRHDAHDARSRRARGLCRVVCLFVSRRRRGDGPFWRRAETLERAPLRRSAKGRVDTTVASSHPRAGGGGSEVPRRTETF